jgi:hypothetical protein
MGMEKNVNERVSEQLLGERKSLVGGRGSMVRSSAKTGECIESKCTAAGG